MFYFHFSSSVEEKFQFVVNKITLNLKEVLQNKERCRENVNVISHHLNCHILPRRPSLYLDQSSALITIFVLDQSVETTDSVLSLLIVIGENVIPYINGELFISAIIFTHCTEINFL